MQVTMTHSSDTGRVRQGNEDSVVCVADPERRRGSLVVVADGMGGAQAGEEASGIAVRTIAEVFLSSEEPLAASLGGAVQEANRRIWQASLEPGKNGMGTTCSALALLDGTAAVAQVGDSRVYRFRRGILHRLTRVHSIWAEAVARDGVSPKIRSGQNVLTRALGVEGAVDVDVHEDLGVESGDVYLLCSDGLWGQVTDPELAWALENLGGDAACRHLVDLANARGGPDNITVALAAVDSGSDATRSEESHT